MSGGKGSVPMAPAAPDNTEADKKAAEELSAAMRLRRGRAANIGTSAVGLLGLNESGNSVSKLGG